MSSPASVIFPPVALPGQTQLIASGLQFTLTGAENLRLSCFNSLPGVTIALQGRRRLNDGTVQPFAFTFTPTSDRMRSTQDFPLGEGAILNVVAFAIAAQPVIGQTFVQVKIILGISGATIVLGTLLQGYVTAAQELGWPGSPIQSSLDGGGYVRHIDISPGAAGLEFSTMVPTGARWNLLGVFGILKTAGAAGVRLPILILISAIGRIVSKAAPGGIDTGTQSDFYWLPNMATDYRPAIVTVITDLPSSCPLLAGNTVSSTTQGIQAGDVWETVQLTVQEWLEAQ